jgi:hypothetical protein
VDLTKASTSVPTLSLKSSTDREVITEVTIPVGVSISTSETTGPAMISLILPLNWFLTLIASIDMFNLLIDFASLPRIQAHYSIAKKACVDLNRTRTPGPLSYLSCCREWVVTVGVMRLCPHRPTRYEIKGGLLKPASELISDWYPLVFHGNLRSSVGFAGL